MSKAHKTAAPNGRVRIIGGRWRGRLISFPGTKDLRPTGDRIRETLFNWLQARLFGANCLDLFAGSGALGLEALSRGASTVVLIEQNSAAVQALRSNCTALSAEGCCVVAADAITWLATQPPAKPFDIVFLDPPFTGDLLAAAAQALEQNHWLSPDALVYVETPARREPDTHTLVHPAKLPDNWRLDKQKITGEVNYRLYHRI